MLALAPSLLDLVQDIAADRQQWQPHVRFTEGSRYWQRLAQLPAADVWLLTWLPDQTTDLHDHGEAAAAFTVVTGVLTEVRARPDGVLSSSELPAGSTQTVPAGAVHDVANLGTAPAISIHAYSPRLTTMTFWETVPGGIRRVSSVRTDQPEVA